MHGICSFEVDAPLVAVHTALTDQSIWPRLVPGLVRTGEYWQYGDDLYTVVCRSAGASIEVEATCAGDRRVRLQVQITLRDTLVTTALDVRVTLDQPTSLRSLLLARPAQRDLLRRCCHAARVLGALLQRSHPTPAAGYPRTRAAFEAMGAAEDLQRVARLDSLWEQVRAGQPPVADPPVHERVAFATLDAQYPSTEYDLIYAGGGLGLLHAAVMARRYGWRVLVFDRGEVGCAHREWNISREELPALVEAGLCTWDELERVVMARYDRGVVRFHADPGEQVSELWLDDVLSVALDAGALLRLARHKLAEAGGVVLDHRSFRRVLVSDDGPVRVVVELTDHTGRVERHTARLLLDGMGSVSPLALQRFAGRPFAGVCPTVGTVASGFVAGDAPNQHNPRIGDILISVAHAQRGQQYMWEGFPGRGDELTVYLFYYDTLLAGGSAARTSPTLMQLFEDYFELLPSYKLPGEQFRHIKPVYGYIPARHSVRRQEAPLLRGVLPVGDSSAQQSPLTFCGFGSHVRNLERTTALLHAALTHGMLEPRQLSLVSAFQVNASLNWVFSRFMQPWGAPDDVNRLQNHFLAVLNQLGPDLAQRFFRDRMIWSDYHRMVLGMFRRHRPIVAIAWRVLGPSGVRRWVSDYLVYSWAALQAWGGRALGEALREGLASAVERRWPELAFALRARYAEWRAMGWI